MRSLTLDQSSCDAVVEVDGLVLVLPASAVLRSPKTTLCRSGCYERGVSVFCLGSPVSASTHIDVIARTNSQQCSLFHATIALQLLA